MEELQQSAQLISDSLLVSPFASTIENFSLIMFALCNPQP